MGKYCNKLDKFFLFQSSGQDLDNYLFLMVLHAWAVLLSWQVKVRNVQLVGNDAWMMMLEGESEKQVSLHS